MWVVFAALAGVAFWRGWQFRRGTSRALLPLYRSNGAPNYLRNLPLVADFVGAGTLVFVSALLWLIQSRGDLTPPVFQALALLIVGLAMVGLGAVIILLHSPPKRLTPRWLALADDRDGFVSPKSSFGDHLVLLIGLALTAVGLYFVYAAIFIRQPLG
jgi:hypothetical protein